MQTQAYSNSQNHTGKPLRTILQRTFLSPCYQGKACSQALDVRLPIALCTCTGPSAGPAVCRGPCVPSELFLVVQVSRQKKSLHQTRCPAAPERRATEWLRLSIPQHLTVPLKRNFPIGTQQPAPTTIPSLSSPLSFEGRSCGRGTPPAAPPFPNQPAFLPAFSCHTIFLSSAD